MAAHDRHRLSRRRFLGAMGASAGAAALNPGGTAASPGRPRAARGRAALAPEHFGRIFRLPPFAQQSPKVEAALRELGKPGGLLDVKDPLAAGPKQLIVDLSLSANNPNNPNHTAATTFFGQFLDHDMTFDADSRLAQRPSHGRRATTARRPWIWIRSTAPGSWPSRSCTTHPTTSSSSSKAAACSKTCPAARTARRSSATRATTRTSSSRGCIAPSPPSTTARSTTCAARHRRRGRRVRGGAAADHLALALADRHRVPAPDRRPGHDRSRAPARSAPLHARPRRGVHARRVPDRHYRMGHSMVRPSYRASLAATTGSRSSPSSSTPPRRAGPTPTTSEAAPARRADSSAGRPSSTSATASQAQQAHRHEDLQGQTSRRRPRSRPGASAATTSSHTPALDDDRARRWRPLLLHKTGSLRRATRPAAHCSSYETEQRRRGS
jgi:hypothetical protein